MADLRITIEAYDLPGSSCSPRGAGRRYDAVRVGVQRGKEVVDAVAGDAVSARWAFDVSVRDGPDLGGPYVHGKRGDRFFYLCWLAGDLMFRRAKLHVADVPQDVFDEGLARGALTCRVRLQDRCGDPICARVRPPDVAWS